jgi:long-subunit fatty acid transport protein
MANGFEGDYADTIMLDSVPYPQTPTSAQVSRNHRYPGDDLEPDWKSIGKSWQFRTAVLVVLATAVMIVGQSSQREKNEPRTEVRSEQGEYVLEGKNLVWCTDNRTNCIPAKLDTKKKAKIN